MLTGREPSTRAGPLDRSVGVRELNLTTEQTLNGQVTDGHGLAAGHGVLETEAVLSHEVSGPHMACPPSNGAVDENRTLMTLENISKPIDRLRCVRVVISSERDMDVLHAQTRDNSGFVKRDPLAIVHLSGGSEVHHHGHAHLLEAAERRFVRLAANQDPSIPPETTNLTVEPVEFAREAIILDSNVDDGSSLRLLP